jgi:2-polyprenyl-3-methyl-5-hydroxy-6-metoxy-1,4-benzoquinol methylase
MDKLEKHAIKKEYWEKNIENYSGFYYVKSEENIKIPFGLSAIYKKFLFPLERKVTLERYNNVCSFIDKNIKSGMKVADVGCGSGIFSKKIIEKGAFVYAMDYTASALELTKRNLGHEELNQIELIQVDITKNKIPPVDIAISIGVLPYIDELDKYFGNILPNTNLFLFNYINKYNIFNMVRRILSFLNVRNYSYHDFNEISTLAGKYGFKVVEKKKLGTGFIIELKKL